VISRLDFRIAGWVTIISIHPVNQGMQAAGIEHRAAPGFYIKKALSLNLFQRFFLPDHIVCACKSSLPQD
jgi:hypothetical protein